MGKFDLQKVVETSQKLYHKNDAKGIRTGTGESLRSMADGNFLIMPKWWQEATNTKGLPFGGYVMIAGDTDSGKTSGAIAAMRAAQEQGIAIIYVETENKTTKKDMEEWGVDLSQMMVVKTSIVEEAFDELFRLWAAFEAKYPSDRLLVVFDSIGNIISKHDLESEQMTTNQKPGGKGKSNRVGINKLIGKCAGGKVTGFIVNYTYDNIGSPGKTNAGGKALNLFSSLTYQTSRKGWIEATVKGQKVRKGARVQWKLFKNHIDKSNPGPKVVELDITAEGIVVHGCSDDAD